MLPTGGSIVTADGANSYSYSADSNCFWPKCMNGVLGHDSALLRLHWAGDDHNERNFIMNHDPGAGCLARLVDQQSSALPLYRGPPSIWAILHPWSCNN